MASWPRYAIQNSFQSIPASRQEVLQAAFTADQQPPPINNRYSCQPRQQSAAKHAVQFHHVALKDAIRLTELGQVSLALRPPAVMHITGNAHSLAKDMLRHNALRPTAGFARTATSVVIVRIV